MHTTVTEDSENVLLKTIKISKNLFSLTDRLPKPRYVGNYSTIAMSGEERIQD